jgi:hypothetical protein
MILCGRPRLPDRRAKSQQLSRIPFVHQLVSQGEVTYHSEEHLVGTDKGIVLLRRLLKSASKTVADGGDPPLAFGQDDILIDTSSAGLQIGPDPDFVPPEASSITDEALAQA